MMSGLKKMFNNGYVLMAMAAILFSVGNYYRIPQVAEYRFLVAEKTGSPFERTVVLVTKHNRMGARGYIVNKPGYGGPLLVDKTTVIYTNDFLLDHGSIIKDLKLGIAEGEVAAADLKKSVKKPSWHITIKGMAGWGPKQLDREIRQGRWKVVDYSRKTLRTTKASALWSVLRKEPAAK